MSALVTGGPPSFASAAERSIGTYYHAHLLSAIAAGPR